MVTDKKSSSKKNKSFIRNLLSRMKNWWSKNIFHKIITILLLAIMFWVLSLTVVAQWYIDKHKHEPLVFGATFIQDYVEYYGLNPKDTMSAIINDLGIKHLRLVSYWKDIESTPGTYDFSQLDWQFKEANKTGTKVSLAIGLRQPRWPECQEPKWVDSMTEEQWYPRLKDFMKQVIDRYKNNPALESYQLENEYFMKAFGECTNFDRNRLVDEFNFVKSLDPSHPLIISRSNNWIGIPMGQPRPDMFAISVYKRVWDKTVTHRYFEYPLPARFYAMLAGWGEILTGKNMMIHELQAESWLPPNYEMLTAPLSEQDKSMNPQRLKDRIEYGKATGMKRIDLWGVEWWYWHKVKLNDNSLWQTAKEEIANSQGATN